MQSILDENGAVEGAVLVRNDGQLLVARPQALYFYTVEGRGACFAFNEQHHHLAWTGRDLVVVGHVEFDLVVQHLRSMSL